MSEEEFWEGEICCVCGKKVVKYCIVVNDYTYHLSCWSAEEEKNRETESAD